MTDLTPDQIEDLQRDAVTNKKITDEVMQSDEDLSLADDVLTEDDLKALVEAVGSQKSVPGAIMLVINPEMDGAQIYEHTCDELKPWIGKTLMDVGAHIMQQQSEVTETFDPQEETAPAKTTNETK